MVGTHTRVYTEDPERDTHAPITARKRKRLDDVFGAETGEATRRCPVCLYRYADLAAHVAWAHPYLRPGQRTL